MEEGGRVRLAMGKEIPPHGLPLRRRHEACCNPEKALLPLPVAVVQAQSMRLCCLDERLLQFLCPVRPVLFNEQQRSLRKPHSVEAGVGMERSVLAHEGGYGFVFNAHVRKAEFQVPAGKLPVPSLRVCLLVRPQLPPCGVPRFAVRIHVRYNAQRPRMEQGLEKWSGVVCPDQGPQGRRAHRFVGVGTRHEEGAARTVPQHTAPNGSPLFRATHYLPIGVPCFQEVSGNTDTIPSHSLPMNVCYVTSECVPYVKTGGLADVSGALPVALSRLGVHVKLVLPLYDSIRVYDHGFVYASEFHGQSVRVADEDIPFGIWYGHLPDSEVEVYLIDCPRFFHRGYIYTGDPDEVLRFVFLQHVTFRILQHYAWRPDILHANDWQTALLPRLLRTDYAWDQLFAQTRSVLTIHNLAYQGHVPEWLALRLDGVRNCLEDGIRHADRIVTVSPTYAREIQTYAFGEGLDGWLRSRGWDLRGILNGMDTDVWNPSTDPHTSAHYSVDDLDGKRRNTQALVQEFGLGAGDDSLLVGVISRFATQKGLDMLLAVLDDVLDRTSLSFVVLGSGDSGLEDGFRHARNRHPDRVGLRIGYDDALAHRIEAGAHAFLMPSRYEPCGLNQMYSMRYGTLPIVHATGGLADTVLDLDENPEEGTGFVFREPHPHALSHALMRASNAFQDPDRWMGAVRRGMSKDFSWDHATQAWMDVYTNA